MGNLSFKCRARAKESRWKPGVKVPKYLEYTNEFVKKSKTEKINISSIDNLLINQRKCKYVASL